MTVTSQPDGTATLDHCAETVAAYFAAVGADLAVLRDRVLAERAAHGLLTAAKVADAIEADTRAMLAHHPLVGGGFVSAPGFLSDHHTYLAWWQGENRAPLTQSGPWEEAPVDYTRQEWFRTPAATGEPHVAGPYVDYVCSDEYVMTATLPVTFDGQFAGVVGADTLLEVFERLLLPVVRAVNGTVINHHDRVVVAADPRLPAGRLVERASYATAVACAGTPFTVVR